MPELPDIAAYLEALQREAVGRVIERIRVASPIILRTVDPPISAVEGKRIVGLRRIGKRVVFELEGDFFLVVHLMIAGRLRLRERGARIPARVGHAAIDLPDATLLLTEASPTKRAAMHLVRGADALEQFARGGIEPLEAGVEAFAEALRRESHTLKRALTDPTLFSGIGNAYSDEILHRARLSPLRLTRSLPADETERLWRATREVLAEWTERLRQEARAAFPEKVTAFREGMAVHGRYGKPCPVCGTAVQRIRYAQNEANYCPRCQTDGRLLADRALSRILKGDWPRTLEELEERRG